MWGFLSAVLAMVGTLLGSVVAYVLQARSAERIRRVQESERMRELRLAAFRTLAQTLHSLRRAELDQWLSRQQDSEGADATRADELSRSTRPAAWAALAELQLLVDDSDFVQTAQNAYRTTRAIHWAQDDDDRRDRDHAARAAIDAYLAAAARHVR